MDKAPKILDYIEYRAFLKDYFAYLKQTSKSFSLRKLAKDLGLSSPSFLSEVVSGKKNLPQKLVLKLNNVLKLSDQNFSYLDLLVQFNQARSMEEKNYFFQKLSKYRGSKAKVIHRDQYKFYTKWYYSAVWTYFGINQKERNPSKIAEEIFPKITKNQVEASINLLLELGLIHKTANGYAATQKHIVTENPFSGMVASTYNTVLIDMAKDNLTKVKADSRQYNVLMFSISREGFSNIKERIRSFQEELRDIIERDSGEDRIYTLCMQLFPNSKKH